MSDFRLSDLLDLSIIQKMADAHYRAAGMPIGIIDAIDDSVLVGSGWQDICVKFHRANPELCHRCQASDNYIKEHLVVGEACHNKCQNGFWDIGIPIVVEGRHLATMFLGQFFYEEEIPDRAFFTQLAHDFGFEVDDYLAALDRVPVFSHDKVESILNYDKALVGFLADLAEHAILKSKADGMVRASERKFHAIFDQTQHFLGLLSTEGNVLDVNRTALAFTGADETDFIGKPLWETPWWCDSTGRQRDLRQAVEKAAQGELIRFEATQSIDGHLRVLDISIKPVTDEGGKVVLLIAEGRDITDGRQAEEEIKRQAQFLQIVIDAMPYPVFYKDRLGRYLGCNRAYEHFYGVLREKIAGKTVNEVAPKDLADIYYRTDEMLFAHPGTQTYETCIETADEGRHDVIFHKATFEGPDGTLAGIVGAVVDITERKQAEQEKRKLQEQLAVAQKMESVGRLAGGVAHDFNNMLAVILGNAELALNKLSQADAVFPNLEVIQKAAERSADLTRQLLAFARKQTIAPKVLDLNETVGGMLPMLRRLVGEDVIIAWMPGSKLWQVRLDPAQIDQILMNLAANARDAIAGVGKVGIGTKNEIAREADCAAHVGLMPGEYVMLTVSDDGCGMDQETQANIFEPFFTTKDLGKGTGLGLATVYGIVKQNHGFIDVHSELGLGTTFTIYLPRYVGDFSPIVARPPSESMLGGTETVLLVEDEPMLLEVAHTMLLKLGYTVLIAATPGEAFLVANEHSGKIQLLMTDVVMPEMNGLDLAKRMIAKHPHLKGLFMSGYTSNVIANRGVIDEGMPFIQKPFSLRDLAIKIREVLDQP